MEQTEDELLWDNSPEQYEITTVSDEELENVLKPTTLFPTDERKLSPKRHRRDAKRTKTLDLESLTSTDSEGEVFLPEVPAENSNKKLKLTRQIAIRRKPGVTVINCPRNTCNLEEVLELAANDVQVVDDEDQTKADVISDDDRIPEVTPRRSERLNQKLDYNLLNESGERTYKETGAEGRGRR